MSAGSPLSATQRNGPFPSQNSGRMYSGTKPGMSNAFSHAGLLRLRANVVAVIESDRAASFATRASLRRAAPSTASSARCIRPDLSRATASASCKRHPVRHITVQRIVRAGLIGQNVGHDHRAAPSPAGHPRSCRPARPRPPVSSCAPVRSCPALHRANRRSCRNNRSAVASRFARIDFDAEKERAVHRRGQRLRAAHSAQPAGNEQICLRANRRNVVTPAAAKVSNVPCTIPWLPM